MWCGQVLGDFEAAQEIRAEQKEVRNAAFRLVKANPELIDGIEAARDLGTVFENNPELFDEVQKFQEALSSD
jgi:hypothetical protein